MVYKLTTACLTQFGHWQRDNMQSNKGMRKALSECTSLQPDLS